MSRIFILFVFLYTSGISVAEEIIPETRFQVRFHHLLKKHMAFCNYFPATIRCGGSGDESSLNNYKTLQSEFYTKNLNNIIVLENNVRKKFLPFKGRAPSSKEIAEYESDMRYLDKYSRDSRKAAVGLVTEIALKIQGDYLSEYEGIFARDTIYQKNVSSVGPAVGFAAGAMLLNRMDGVTQTGRIFDFIRKSTPLRTFGYLVGYLGPVLSLQVSNTLWASEDRVLPAPPSPAHFIHFNFAARPLGDENFTDEEILKLLDSLDSQKDKNTFVIMFSGMLASDGLALASGGNSKLVGALSKLRFFRVTPWTIVVGVSLEAAARKGYGWYQDKEINNEMQTAFTQLDATIKIQKAEKLHISARDMINAQETKERQEEILEETNLAEQKLLQEKMTKAMFAMNVLEVYHIRETILKLHFYGRMFNELKLSNSDKEFDAFLQKYFQLEAEGLQMGALSEFKQQYCTDVIYGSMTRSKDAITKLYGKWRVELKGMRKKIVNFSERLNGWIKKYPDLASSGTMAGEILGQRIYQIEPDIMKAELLLKSLDSKKTQKLMESHRVKMFESSFLTFKKPEFNKKSVLFKKLSCEGWGLDPFNLDLLPITSQTASIKAETQFL